MLSKINILKVLPELYLGTVSLTIFSGQISLLKNKFQKILLVSSLREENNSSSFFLDDFQSIGETSSKSAPEKAELQQHWWQARKTIRSTFLKHANSNL